MNVVISQSMYFPWVGFLEQVRAADIYVRYDDVQFSKGSFTNRVQIKTADGSRWMTIPLSGLRLGQRIDEVQISPEDGWRQQHLSKLAQAYRSAPFRDEMLAVAQDVLDSTARTLSDLAYGSILALARHFDLLDRVRWLSADALSIGGTGSERVLAIVRALGGTCYVTGHGARRYLDHEAFEEAGVEVRYMRYGCRPYPQLHGAFTPFVSALDLVAACGVQGERHIQPETVYWREFLDGS